METTTRTRRGFLGLLGSLVALATSPTSAKKKTKKHGKNKRTRRDRPKIPDSLQGPTDQNSVSTRVAGGSVSDITRHPFTVYVFDGQYMCGGSLLDHQSVATAAHCVHGVNPAKLQVYVGMTNSQSVANSVIGVSYYHTGEGDFAYLRLSTSVDMSLFPPIQLPEAQDAHFYQVGTGLTVVGWGDTSSQKGSETTVLHEAVVPVVSNKTAIKRYKLKGGKGKRKGKKSHKSMFNKPKLQFAAGGPMSDTCPGDSGGPAIGYRPDGTPVLVGITSWGGNRCASKQPGVYVKVLAIAQQLRNWMAA